MQSMNKADQPEMRGAATPGYRSKTGSRVRRAYWRNLFRPEFAILPLKSPLGTRPCRRSGKGALRRKRVYLCVTQDIACLYERGNHETFQWFDHRDPIRMPGLESAAIGVYVNCGGRHETKPVMGVSHMLEHMAFKGTKHRTAPEIAEEMENVGGFLNAYTSREQTAFHARVAASADVPLGIDIIWPTSSRIRHSIKTEVWSACERQVVLQELGQARDTPDDIVFDHLQAVAYPDQPMGWPILGEEKTVSNFSREDLSTYMDANYRTQRDDGSIASAVRSIASLDREAGRREIRRSENRRRPEGASRARLGAAANCAADDDLEQVPASPTRFPVSPATIRISSPRRFTRWRSGGGIVPRASFRKRARSAVSGYTIYAFAQSSSTDSGMIGVYTVAPARAKRRKSRLSSAGEMVRRWPRPPTKPRSAAPKRSSGQVWPDGIGEALSTRTEQIASQLLAYGRALMPVS